MGRRLLFFAFGAFISIILLSMGPENRMKKTFYAYIDYFNIDYYNPNSIKEKIIELCSMSLSEIQEKYKDTFAKAEKNKILVNKIIKKRYGQFGIEI